MHAQSILVVAVRQSVCSLNDDELRSNGYAVVSVENSWAVNVKVVELVPERIVEDVMLPLLMGCEVPGALLENGKARNVLRCDVNNFEH
jgi:DNA-binding response OmpR family regulator